MSSLQRFPVGLVNPKPKGLPTLMMALSQVGCEGIPIEGDQALASTLSKAMPYAIILELDSNTITLGNFIKALNQDPILRLIPLLVRGALDPAAQKALARLAVRFFGCVPSTHDIGLCARMVKNALSKLSDNSPWCIDWTLAGQQPEAVLNFEISILGSLQDQVVLSGACTIPSETPVVVVPQPPDLPPVMLKHGQSRLHDQKTLIFYPVGRAMGKGLAWVRSLAPYMQANDTAAPPAPRILFYHPVAELGLQFQEILTGYGFEIELVHTMATALSRLRGNLRSFSAVFLFELLLDASGIAWRKSFEAMPPDVRPSLIVATSSLNSRSTPACTYLYKPFGIGVLVDTLNSIVGLQGSAGAPIASIKLAATATFASRIVSISESSATVSMRAPLPSGGGARMIHPVLNAALGSDFKVQVASGKAVDGRSDQFEAKIDFGWELGSRAGFFRKIFEMLPTNFIETIAANWRASYAPKIVPKTQEIAAKAVPSATLNVSEKTPEASVKGQLLNALIQSTRRTFDYYIGTVPAMGKPQSRTTDAAFGRMTALCEFRVVDLTLMVGMSLDQALLTLMAHRVCGIRPVKGKLTKDSILEVGETLADQIMYGAELLLEPANVDSTFQLLGVVVDEPTSQIRQGSLVLPMTVESSGIWMELSNQLPSQIALKKTV